VKSGLLLRRIRVDPARSGELSKNLPFLSRGPVEIQLRSSLTLLVGENGSGKTTLLEAVAANCAIRPGGGRSYTETEDEREDTAILAAVEVSFRGRRPKGLFLRADRFAETMARAGRLPMPTTGEWRLLDEQNCGEGVLSYGDRQFVKTLAAVLENGLAAVAAACEEALAAGIASGDVILTILARKQQPALPASITTPDALRLKCEPMAD